MVIPTHLSRWAETLSAPLEVATPGFVELRGEALVDLQHFAEACPTADGAAGRLRRVRSSDEPVAQTLMGPVLIVHHPRGEQAVQVAEAGDDEVVQGRQSSLKAGA